MNDLEVLGKIGTEAVMRLRAQKLASGKPFMINSSKLPGKQSYLEFPDKTIKLVTIASDSRSFVILGELSQKQTYNIRRKYNLL